MCLLCADWNKGKLTSKEALRNLGEMLPVMDGEERDHLIELADRIMEEVQQDFEVMIGNRD